MAPKIAHRSPKGDSEGTRRTDMPLDAITRQLIAEVERTSGRPVIVQADPSLPVFASVATARGSAPAHVVRYKPGAGQPADYFVTFQLSFVIPLFSCPPKERWQVLMTRNSAGPVPISGSTRSRRRWRDSFWIA